MIADQLLAQRVACRKLKLGIQRSAHPQPTSINAVAAIVCRLAELIDQLAADFFEKIAGIGRTLAALLDEAQILTFGRSGFLGRDEIVGDHLVEHEVAAGNSKVVIPGAAVTFGCLGQDGQKRHLVQIEITDILVEVSASGSLHTEAASPKRDLVQIQFEDFLLGQHAFDACGEDHFLQLAGDRIFVAQQQVFGDLLGNGRATHRALARTKLRGIIDYRVRRSGNIHPAVAEKGLVLGRKERVDQFLRKIHILELDAPFAGISVDDFAIDAAHYCGQRRFIFQQRFGVREIATERRPCEQEHDDGEPAKVTCEAQPAAMRPIVIEPIDQALGIAHDAIAIVLKG